MISTDVFYDYLTDNRDSYTLIKNFLSEKDLNKCLDIAKGLERTDNNKNYESRLFDPQQYLDSDHFFCQLDIQKLGKIYGFDNVDEYQWEIARDEPEFCNDFHTDVKCNKNVVTMQWYLDMDDTSRKLHIGTKSSVEFDDWDTDPSVQELDTTANSMVAFLAKPNTNHGFKSGKGYRYNVRLRLFENLKNDTFIHNCDNNKKICWFIDVKDMEVEDYPKDDQEFSQEEDGSVEDYLARFTYECLLSLQQSNILVNDKIRQYPKTLQYLKDQGFEKCVIVMAGTCITAKTVEYVTNQTDDYPVYGELFDDLGCLLRRLAVINLNEVDISKADGFNHYLSAYIDNFKQVSIDRDLGCLYVHPEESTYRALYDMSRYPISTMQVIDRFYPELDDEDRDIIKKMMYHYHDTVLPSFPEVTLKTLTT